MKRVSNPPNPFESQHRELLEPAPEAHLDVYEDSSRSILSRNESPDIPYRWSVNPYRGCFHSCAYCYARKYHEYLGFGAGTDFESKIVIKPNAPALLRREFEKRSWAGELVSFSGVTDCYQPVEAEYRLTRQCLEVCAEFQNPASIITKGFLVTRDIDVLSSLHRRAWSTVILSIPFATDDLARKIEPQASTVKRRFEAMAAIAKAGVPVGISLAPTIPGLNDNDIPILLRRAKDAGATFAFHALVHLSGSVLPVFTEKIKAALPPSRVERVMNRLREARAGKIDESRVGKRMVGSGPYWQAIADLFALQRQKFGLDRFPEPPTPSPFRRPTKQLVLEL